MEDIVMSRDNIVLVGMPVVGKNTLGVVMDALNL